MSTEEWVKVRIANTTLQVPVYVDEATTLKIAEEISKRFTEIEENSARIDTLAFALFTAFSYATEKHELEAQQDEDNRSMVKALDSITSRLDELTERFGVGDEE